MNHLVGQFVYLQILDVLSTLAFLGVGVEEANPFIRMLIEAGPHPLPGLLAVKTIGILLGIYCWRSGRQRLLYRANVFFVFLVLWNLVALFHAPGQA